MDVMSTLRGVVHMGNVLRVLYHRPSGPLLLVGSTGENTRYYAALVAQHQGEAPQSQERTHIKFQRPRTCLGWIEVVRLVAGHIDSARLLRHGQGSAYTVLWMARAIVVHPAGPNNCGASRRHDT
jgi:hypothetical protein